MSDSDFAKYIIQKYSLAVALSVIKSKPNNSTMLSYIDDLKSKIETQINIDSYFDEVSIHDTDFNDSDENDISRTILKDVNLIEADQESEFVNIIDSLKDIDTCISIKPRMKTSTPNNLSQTTFNESPPSLKTIQNVTQNDITFCGSSQDNSNRNKSVTHYVKFKAPATNIIDPQETELYTVYGLTEHNTHISQSQETVVVSNKLLHSFNVNESKDLNENNKSSDKKYKYNAAVKRRCDGILIEPKVSDLKLKKSNQISIVNGVMKKMKIYESLNTTQVCIEKNAICTDDQQVNRSIDDLENITQKTIDNDPLNINKTLMESQIISSSIDSKNNIDYAWENLPILEDYHLTQRGNNLSQRSRTRHITETDTFPFNTQTTELNRRTGIENNDSLKENLDVQILKLNDTKNQRDNSISIIRSNQSLNSNDKYNLNSKLNEINSRTSNVNTIDSDISDNTTNNYKPNDFFNKDNVFSGTKNKLMTDLSLNFSFINSYTQNQNERLNLNSSITDSLINSNVNCINSNLMHSSNNIVQTDTFNTSKTFSNRFNSIRDDHQQLNANEVTENKTQELNFNKNDSQDTPDDFNATEIVTFKVLEELNKIKKYLCRRDRNAGDLNGSNSQSMASFKTGSQYSDNWINESGHCLLDFIAHCPLIPSSLEITEEISIVLGQFVDRLHEDENYPTFLEKYLTTVRELLKGIYENCQPDEELRNNENIDRLLLFNRSYNIMQFTLEKIISFLKEIHIKIKEGILEGYCEESENLCYIFHIFEIMLKRYINISRCPTQSQPSQELKRSDITEIWRKEWRLSKHEIGEGGCKKKSVLTECSQILNKIIVSAMDGYSLVAFAALQCFNLLQK